MSSLYALERTVTTAEILRINSLNITTKEQLLTYERSLIKKYQFYDLAVFHYYHDKLGYYDRFNCSFYITTTPDKRPNHRYKLGYTTQNSRELTKRSKNTEPNTKVILLYPGYAILEYLMLNYAPNPLYRIPHDTGILSEVVQANLIEIQSCLNFIISTPYHSEIIQQSRELEERESKAPLSELIPDFPIPCNGQVRVGNLFYDSSAHILQIGNRRIPAINDKDYIYIRLYPNVEIRISLFTSQLEIMNKGATKEKRFRIYIKDIVAIDNPKIEQLGISYGEVGGCIDSTQSSRQLKVEDTYFYFTSWTPILEGAKIPISHLWRVIFNPVDFRNMSLNEMKNYFSDIKNIDWFKTYCGKEFPWCDWSRDVCTRDVVSDIRGRCEHVFVP